jgi:hypothetical protein
MRVAKIILGRCTENVVFDSLNGHDLRALPQPMGPNPLQRPRNRVNGFQSSQLPQLREPPLVVQLKDHPLPAQRPRHRPVSHRRLHKVLITRWMHPSTTENVNKISYRTSFATK